VSSSSEYSSQPGDSNPETHARPPLRSAPVPNVEPPVIETVRENSVTSSADRPAPNAVERPASSSSYRIPRTSRPSNSTARPNTTTSRRTDRPRQILSIRQRQAVAIELRQRRLEQRPRRRTTFSCSRCTITCNSRAAFSDHLKGRRHLNARALQNGLPKCTDCDREFESDSHYQRHIRGKNHLKTVTAIENNK
jgi:Zinc-finger double-stranded RNA-binding/Zinc-finger of C2H2 type